LAWLRSFQTIFSQTWNRRFTDVSFFFWNYCFDFKVIWFVWFYLKTWLPFRVWFGCLHRSF
jgi:hypothetical protein